MAKRRKPTPPGIGEANKPGFTPRRRKPKARLMDMGGEQFGHVYKRLKIKR